jgi:hypothetical protein
MGWDHINWWRVSWRKALWNFLPAGGIERPPFKIPMAVWQQLGHAPKLIPTYWISGLGITVEFWFAEDGTKFTKFEVDNPYRMLPTDDGGESYRMECIICKEEGSIMGKFYHKPGCPAQEKWKE